MKMIEKKDTVDAETYKTYESIDGLKLIEEYLLFKGTDNFRTSMKIPLSELEKMAYLEYRLKVNATNKLYVGMFLDRFYIRNGLYSEKKGNGNASITIPKEIFNKVDEIHKKYKANS